MLLLTRTREPWPWQQRARGSACIPARLPSHAAAQTILQLVEALKTKNNMRVSKNNFLGSLEEQRGKWEEKKNVERKRGSLEKVRDSTKEEMCKEGEMYERSSLD